ncbi:MAG: hypothetical protein HZB32_05230 [Nitrospirae bacterium]|nr:hypothetical protein [Nitrospirota bacterium]
MNKPARPFFMTIFYLGLLFLMVSPAIAEPPADISITQTASAQQQPGSKEPEGLEPEPPSSFSIGWDVTIASKYLFQGRDYSNNKPVDQPEVILTLKDFAAILLNPSLSIHYDFDAGDGYYATLGVSHGIETSIGALTPRIKLFYQANYYELTGFPSAEFNGTLEYSIGFFSISPSISYFLTWNNGDFQADGPEGTVPDTWLFSINAAQSF